MLTTLTWHASCMHEHNSYKTDNHNIAHWFYKIKQKSLRESQLGCCEDGTFGSVSSIGWHPQLWYQYNNKTGQQKRPCPNRLESKSWMALPQRSLAGAKGAQLAMLSGWVGWHTLALPLSIKATRGSLRAHLLSRLHCHVTQHEQQFERRSWNASHVLKEARASLHPP